MCVCVCVCVYVCARVWVCGWVCAPIHVCMSSVEFKIILFTVIRYLFVDTSHCS